VSVTAIQAVADELPPWPRDGGFIDALVTRLHTQYGGDPEAIRRLAAEAFASFVDAPVQAFVPILVEKRLRHVYRRVEDRPGPATLAAAPRT